MKKTCTSHMLKEHGIFIYMWVVENFLQTNL
jgi:hypothetical protein